MVVAAKNTGRTEGFIRSRLRLDRAIRHSPFPSSLFLSLSLSFWLLLQCLPAIMTSLSLAEVRRAVHSSLSSLNIVRRSLLLSISFSLTITFSFPHSLPFYIRPLRPLYCAGAVDLWAEGRSPRGPGSRRRKVALLSLLLCPSSSLSPFSQLYNLFLSLSLVLHFTVFLPL